MSAPAATDSASSAPTRDGPVPYPVVRRLLPYVALPALYYGSAKVGYALDFAGPVAAILWLPVGVGIAFLYLGGLQLWPGVLVGDLLANDYSALPLGSALGQTAGNVLEVLVAVLLIRRLVGPASPLGTAGNLMRMLAALGAGTTVSATVGTVSLRLGGVISADAWAHIWRTWWLGDLSGALVVVPLAIAWCRPDEHGGWRRRPVEAVVVLGAVVALTEVAFRGGATLVYVVFPALIWAALRFGQRGATLAVAVTAGVTVWDTTHYAGPFAFDSITRTILSTQLYIAVAAVSALALAAVVTERERFADRLGASRARLVEASDAAMHRLERDLHDGAQQRLTALAVSLDLAAIESRQYPSRAPALFEDAADQLAIAIDDLRRLAQGLHPSVLSEFGLPSAVRDLASRSTVPVVLCDLSVGRLDRTAEITGYFVFAEALTNAQRHARATRIRVWVFASPGWLHVIVADDGVGGAAQWPGSGLEGLRDRVEATGGRFAIADAARGGTQVSAAIPLAAGGSASRD